MPVRSKAQNRLMHAAAAKKGGVGGVSQKVAREFTDSEKGKKLSGLPEKVKKPKKSGKVGDMGEIIRSGFTKGGPASD